MVAAMWNGAVMACTPIRRRLFAATPKHSARSREPTRDDEDTVPAPAFVRWFRRWCRCALPGEARDQVVLVPDMAGSAGRPGARQQVDRRAAGQDRAGGGDTAGGRLRAMRDAHLHTVLCVGCEGRRGDEGGQSIAQ